MMDTALRVELLFLPAVAIENAQHHVFLDQPQAFIDVLKNMLTELRT